MTAKQVVAVKHCVFLSILIVLILLFDSGFCLTFYYMFVDNTASFCRQNASILSEIRHLKFQFRGACSDFGPIRPGRATGCSCSDVTVKSSGHA